MERRGRGERLNLVRTVVGAIGAWGRNYLWAPRYRRAEMMTLTAEDGTRLSASHLAGPQGAFATVVLVHGFLNWSRTPAVHAFARRLAQEVNVIVVDLRGHGRSGGRCTLGVEEPLDVEAAVASAPQGVPVVTVGVSLGGSAAIVQAGRFRNVAGVVAVSAPGWSGSVEREGSAAVHRWVASPLMRLVLASLMRTRTAKSLHPVAESSATVAAISPSFAIFVHDRQDRFFGPEHAEALYGWAGEPKQLWWVDGAGHGADVLTESFAVRLVGELRSKLETRSPIA